MLLFRHQGLDFLVLARYELTPKELIELNDLLGRCQFDHQTIGEKGGTAVLVGRACVLILRAVHDAGLIKARVDGIADAFHVRAGAVGNDGAVGGDERDVASLGGGIDDAKQIVIADQGALLGGVDYLVGLILLVCSEGEFFLQDLGGERRAMPSAPRT